MKQELTRQECAKMLNLSIRTIDRYIKNGKISSFVRDGRVFVDKYFVLVKFGLQEREIVEVDNVSTVFDDVDNLSTKESKNYSDGVFEKLYLELREDLKIKEGRIEIANYRVGQLEAQLKSSIPMLEYRNEIYERNKKEVELEGKINEQDKVIRKFFDNLKQQKFSKRVFAILLFIVLAIQPLWLLLFFE